MYQIRKVRLLVSRSLKQKRVWDIFCICSTEVLKQLFLCVATCKIYFAAFSALLGNILALELPYRSGYPASLIVLMYLGIYLTLNEAKIAAAGITHSVLL